MRRTVDNRHRERLDRGTVGSVEAETTAGADAGGKTEVGAGDGGGDDEARPE
ncbi:hypothetical protein [Haladaptatus salinisoli]|uniref:hypothetical protein n=1 Tax=Haladaptatus salinisoli TaxID=2884876 RepID=UPI001D0A6D9B|nr:hypothetical protein [Haladaptatus salinisoli]